MAGPPAAVEEGAAEAAGKLNAPDCYNAAMRLWSLHPCYLDVKGLTAQWREGLLALKVLKGETTGYRHHPQLWRFRQQDEPVSAIQAFLGEVLVEANRRGYRFNRDKIAPADYAGLIPVTEGQLGYELNLLRTKLAARDPERLLLLPSNHPRVHPLFTLTPGDVEHWERVRG